MNFIILILPFLHKLLLLSEIYYYHVIYNILYWYYCKYLAISIPRKYPIKEKYAKSVVHKAEVNIIL